MAKNSTEAYGAEGKSNVLFFKPENLHLVLDEASPLFDPRVNMPLNEALVLNIMHHGVVQPIVINKNTETGAVEVVAGRQRVRAAREANLRLTAQGLDPVQVPAIPRRAEGADLAGVMISENEIREGDTPLGRAQKMRRLIEFGKTEDQLGVIFGCSSQTVRNTLALLDCVVVVRNAVEAGKINVSHALKLAKMDPPAQRETLASLVSAGDGLSGHRKARQQAAVVSPGPKMRTPKEIRERLEASTGRFAEALRWVLGHQDEPAA